MTRLLPASDTDNTTGPRYNHYIRININRVAVENFCKDLFCQMTEYFILRDFPLVGFYTALANDLISKIKFKKNDLISDFKNRLHHSSFFILFMSLHNNIWGHLCPVRLYRGCVQFVNAWQCKTPAHWTSPWTFQ